MCSNRSDDDDQEWGWLGRFGDPNLAAHPDGDGHGEAITWGEGDVPTVAEYTYGHRSARARVIAFLLHHIHTYTFPSPSESGGLGAVGGSDREHPQP